MARLSLRTWWKLSGEEPYRIFFPLGIVAGILGVLLWPLYYAGGGWVYPGILHSRMMIQGFVVAFMIGFLGTAGPRILESPSLCAREISLTLVAWLSPLVAHGLNFPVLGDLLFLASLLFYVGLAVPRWRRRKDLPPGDFPLVVGGWLSAFGGTLLLILANSKGVPPGWLHPTYIFGKTLLFQGFPLLPILGVSRFFFWRILGGEARVSSPGMREITPSYRRVLILPSLLVLLLWGTYFLEARGMGIVGPGMRLLLVAWWFLSLLWKGRGIAGRPPSLGWILKAALILAVAGIGIPGLAGIQKVGSLHVFFIGGMTLVILVVSTWVSFAHAGYRSRLAGRLWSLEGVAGLLLLALATRITADFILSIRESHLVYAAVAWSAALLWWGGILARRCLEAESLTP